MVYWLKVTEKKVSKIFNILIVCTLVPSIEDNKQSHEAKCIKLNDIIKLLTMAVPDIILNKLEHMARQQPC